MNYEQIDTILEIKELLDEYDENNQLIMIKYIEKEIVDSIHRSNQAEVERRETERGSI